MHLSPLHRTAAALSLALLVTACGDSAGPTESDVSAAVATATTLDIATVAGDAAKEDVETFRVNRGAFGIGQTLDFERFSRWDPCPYVVASSRFVCAERTRGPFTYARSYAYANAAGAAMNAFSPTLTAAANFKWSISGTITKTRWSGSVSRNRDLTFSGLNANSLAITVNGTGSGERQRTVFLRDSAGPNGLTREYTMDASLVIKNVVTSAIPLPDAYPASGTITRDYSVTRTDATNGTTTTTRNSVVTFNGTALVSLVVNGKEFILNLDTGAVTPKSA